MSAQLPRPIQTILDAANSGDTDAFLAAFTPDGVVDDWGREFRNPAQIAGWSDSEFIGADVNLHVEDIELHGSRTVVCAEIGGNGFNGPSHFTFEMDGNLVSRMTIRQ